MDSSILYQFDRDILKYYHDEYIISLMKNNLSSNKKVNSNLYKDVKEGIVMNVIDFKFRNEIIKHNVTLSYCYQCSTCSGGCPVALITEGRYNPRKIIEEAILGFQGRLIDSKDQNIWLCSTCQKCVELCPQKVELTQIFTLIKNKCFNAGKCPEAFYSQAQAILEHGVAIPYSRAINTRREKLGLPDVKTAPTDEVKKIMQVTKFDQLASRVSE